MKKCIYTLIIYLFIFNNSIFTQSVADSVLYNRLYYTAKVWGYLKYFHTEVAKGNKNWDKTLESILDKVKNDVTNEDFNNSLLDLFNAAGEMALPTTTEVKLSDSLKINLNLEWFNDEIFTADIFEKLETIKNRFRPQSNYYLDNAGAGNPVFEKDMQYYSGSTPQYPDEKIRLLGLFRYWNIINYFNPNNFLMDQNWDVTLKEFIPIFINANDANSYHNAFLKIAKRINDSHAFTSSSIISPQNSYYFFPFKLKFVENETVITEVYKTIDNINVGDIIKSIGGIDIYSYRDSLRETTIGSNDPSIERNINNRILRGTKKDVSLILQDENGLKEVLVSQNIYSSDYYNLAEKKDEIWKVLSPSSKKIGYVDMGRLEVSHIESMFTDLWDSDAIIFDIRNYPNGTMWGMIRYLFDSQINIANFTSPDINYPGTIKWIKGIVGTGDFSKTYKNNIFLLFDEETQSQAEYTIMGLEQHPKAIKIGSQTAGADGNISKIFLPGGIYTFFSGLGVYYPDNSQTQRIGIVPDIEILPTINGIRDGKDEVLEVAIKHELTNISEKNQVLETSFRLEQNYPNPFNPTTKISYFLAQNSLVSLKIFDVLGREIKSLINEEKDAGKYVVELNASNLSSGIYFYKLKTNNYSETKKMILLK